MYFKGINSLFFHNSLEVVIIRLILSILSYVYLVWYLVLDILTYSGSVIDLSKFKKDISIFNIFIVVLSLIFFRLILFYTLDISLSQDIIFNLYVLLLLYIPSQFFILFIINIIKGHSLEISIFLALNLVKGKISNDNLIMFFLTFSIFSVIKLFLFYDIECLLINFINSLTEQELSEWTYLIMNNNSNKGLLPPTGGGNNGAGGPNHNPEYKGLILANDDNTRNKFWSEYNQEERVKLNIQYANSIQVQHTNLNEAISDCNIHKKDYWEAISKNALSSESKHCLTQYKESLAIMDEIVNRVEPMLKEEADLRSAIRWFQQDSGERVTRNTDRKSLKALIFEAKSFDRNGWV